MTHIEITEILSQLFPQQVEQIDDTAWRVRAEASQLLVLLSEDHTWLRAMVSIAPYSVAEPYLVQLLEANFDTTQEVRYALHENVLWGMFQHALPTLDAADFERAIARLVHLQRTGLDESFSQLAETQIRQIIQAAKQRGQTLEETLQTLDRFYEEGVMGDLGQSAESRQSVLGAWRYQLERLWDED